jgi:hypothetical protein
LSRVKSSFFPLLAVLAGLVYSANGQEPGRNSVITIHVFKAGLFSVLGHNHVVVAPVAKSNLNPSGLTTEINVRAKELKVTDPGESESTRMEIQNTMLGPKVLDAEKYPDISFQSSRIVGTSPRHFRVTGRLALHGTSREMNFDVVWSSDHYHGSAKLKQTDFGIQPITIGGGAIKVKDEIEVEFDIYGPQPNS